jgi:CRP-like cAMP-binding protein
MTIQTTTPKFRNRLLAALAPDDLASLQPDLEWLSLPRNKILELANRQIDSTYFPEHGLVSVVGGATKPDREVEIGIVGYEGMTGLPVLHGDHKSPHRTFIQIAGDGFLLPASALRRLFENSATFRHLLLRYAQTFMVQATHTSIANARGSLEERLARWILMAQDRIIGNELVLTHEFLSLMLAVRRPGVTESLHALTARGLIEHVRGIILVMDREGLVESTNGLYGIPEAEYDRLLGNGAATAC